MNSRIKLAIITSIPFPNGMAATNRIISYSKGLVENGHQVTVLTTNINSIKKNKNEYLGIKYKHFRRASNSSLFTFIKLFFSIFKLLIFLIRNKKNYNVILIVSNNAPLILLTYIACKLTKLKLIQEKSEFPFVLNNKTFIGRMWAYFYTNIIYRLFDGMIIMTHPLYSYFQKKTKKTCAKIIVPMTVEPERFQNIQTENHLGQYIAYCGYMGGNKDGVMNLIHSFSLIENKYPDLKLLLIGSAGENELGKLKKYTKDLKTKNVIFYGQVERNQMPALLANAKILALARPSGLQSTGGFPTKLGEYLSTGKPVIVTKVGDIPKYLSDNENAFIVEPDNNEVFAKKIEYILDNYSDALKVAKRGSELTQNVFNYKVQSKRIEDFFKNQILK